jgi:hypothetical protein
MNWFEIILVVLLSNFFTGVICWHAGVHNGTKWEQYRERTKAVTQQQPYSGMFDGQSQVKQKPLKVVVKGGKK